MPFPNTRLIPPDLPERYAPTVLGSMTATVRIRRPDPVPHRDTVTGKTIFAPAEAYYAGPARVQGRGGSGPVVAASDRMVDTAGYLVAVPHTVTGVRAGDLVEVVDGDQDPALPGLVLVVDAIPDTATVILQRNLTCSRHTGVMPTS